MQTFRAARFASPPLTFLLAALLAGCASNLRNEAPYGTQVTTERASFRAWVDDTKQHCEAIGGCRCIANGIQTSCALVFSCLRSGLCQQVKAQ
jgi:hypothetical protein